MAGAAPAANNIPQINNTERNPVLLKQVIHIESSHYFLSDAESQSFRKCSTEVASALKRPAVYEKRYICIL
jgi:hypothetical protein